jgi:lipid II:glycine glycyltransferase (peptidoglycan interpeptide bridge formation enzyme)
MTFSVLDIPVEQLQERNNFLQSPFWAEHKARFGMSPRAFQIISIGKTGGEEIGFQLLLFVRKIGGPFSLAYIPHAPSVDLTTRELAALGNSLKANLPPRCLFIRFDLPRQVPRPGILPDDLHRDFNEARILLFKAPVDIQPPTTVLLDLSIGEDLLLAGMKSKTRYNIRLAFKKGVAVREGNGEDLKSWYDLYRETSIRDRISIHSFEYYNYLFSCSGRTTPSIKLLLAEHEEDLLAGIIIAIFGKRSTYLYGASSNKKRNLMASFALQWQAIKLSMEMGCIEYDLFGIPPDDNPTHPMHGLYRFKTGFGGKIQHRSGCWDYPLSAMYRIYLFVEKCRDYYFKKLRKKR